MRDETAARWWRFDDETVTAMPGGPIGERGDHGVASAERKVRRYVVPCVFRRTCGARLKPSIVNITAQGEPGKAGKRNPKGAEPDEDDEVVEVALAAPLSALAPEAGRITSGNAYMLVYRRRGWQPPDGAAGAAVPTACGPLCCLADSLACCVYLVPVFNFAVCCAQAGGGAVGGTRQLPAQLRAVSGASAVLYYTSSTFCGALRPNGHASAQAEREAGLRRIAERQALVREVLDSAPLAGVEAPSRCGLPSCLSADAAWPAHSPGRHLGAQVDLRRVAAQLGRLGDAGPHRQHAAAVRARRRQSRQAARRAPAEGL